MLKANIKPIADDYLRLVCEHPLRRINNDREHAQALRMSGQLIGLVRKLSHGEREYLNALALLIRQYEQTHHDRLFPKVTGIEILRHLMAEHGMTRRQLASLLNVGESATSMILSGHRELTKSHIVALARHFGVGVAAFF